MSIIRYEARLLQSSQNLVLPVGHQDHEDLKSVDPLENVLVLCFHENFSLVLTVLSSEFITDFTSNVASDFLLNRQNFI